MAQAHGGERRLATALLSLASGEVVGKIVTLVTLVWVARTLGIERFGVFTFGMGLGMLVAAIPSFAPTSRMIQLVGSRVETLAVRLAALNIVRWAFTVPAIGIAVPFVLLRSDPMDRWTISLMVLTAILDNSIKVWMAACTALDRQSATALVLVGQRVVTLGLVAFALVAAPSSATAAAAFATGSLLANAAMMLLTRSFGARADYKQLRRQHLRELLAAVPVTAGSNIFSEGLARVDVILIGLLVGDAAVGLYGVAIRLMETALFVSWTLSRALTPDLVRAHIREEMSPPARLGMVLLVALYVPYGAVLAIAGSDLVSFLFGADYDTGSVLLLLSPAPLLFGISHFASTVLFARRPDPAVAMATAVAFGVNLLVNMVLLSHLGAEAAALAKISAFAVQAIILTVSVRKIASLRGSVQGALVATAATAIACLPFLIDLHVLPTVLIAGLVYCVSWYLLTTRFDHRTAAWIARARGERQPRPRKRVKDRSAPRRVR